MCEKSARTFSMCASVAVAYMDSDGRRVEAKSGVKALQSLLQAVVGAEKILERGSDVAWGLGVGGESHKNLGQVGAKQKNTPCR